MRIEDIKTTISRSGVGFCVFGVRSLHEDELVTVGQVMPESYVWDDGDRTDQPIGGTCCFEIPESDGFDPTEAIERAREYSLSTRYALLGGQYTGNSDLITEPDTIAIRDAVVLATWEMR